MGDCLAHRLERLKAGVTQPVRWLRQRGRRTVPRAQHDEAETVLRHTIISGIKHTENDVVAEATHVIKKLSDS